MQRYEFNDGKSSKFWQIEQQGHELHIAWGKIGTQGQSQVKSFDDEAKAQVARDKLIKEKTGKGYVAAGEAPLAAGATPKVAKPASPGSAAAPAKAPAAPRAERGAKPPEPSGDLAEEAKPPAHVAGEAASDAVTDAADANPVPGAAVDATGAGLDNARTWLAAAPQDIDNALAARRAQPSVDEEAVQAWPQVLQALAAGDYENTSAKAFTPLRVKKRFGLSDGAWDMVAAWFEEAHLGSDWGYTTSLQLSANVQADAAKLLARLPADLTQAQVARIQTQVASAWAPVHAGEPGERVADRFGQAILHRLMALPRRDAPGDAPPSLARAKAWQALRKSLRFRFDPSLSHSTFAHGLTVLSTRLAQDEVAPDADADQMLLNVAVHMHNHGEMRTDPAHLVAYLVDAHGLPEVVRMLARSLQATAEFNYGARSHWTLTVWQPGLPNDRSRLHPLQGAWFRVRQHLVHADEAEWQACVAAVLAVLPEVPVARQPLLGPLFAESAEVMAALLGNLPASGALSGESQWLLACTTDAQAVSQLARARDSDGAGLFDTPAALDDMLVRFGLGALPALALAAAQDAPAQRLMAINHPDALHALARVAAQDKGTQARLKQAVARWPLAGLVGLARACVGGGKDVSLLIPVLQDALRQLGPIVSLAAPWLEPAGWAVVVQQANKLAGPVDVATVADLPAVLAQPPWRRARKAKAVAKPLMLEPVGVPAQERWAPGEKEAWHQANHWKAPATSVTAQEAQSLAQDLAFHYRNPKIGYITQCAQAIVAGDAQALIETWLQALARARQERNFYGSLSAAATVALPEPLGLAFWNAVAGEVNVYDPAAPVLQWGVAALPGLTRLMQSRPTEVIELALHVGAVELAPSVARAAFRLKSTRSHALRWLLRWPEHAAAGLIAPALGKPGEDRDVAAKALRLLASQGHADLIHRTAQRYPDAAVAEGVQAILGEDPLDLYPSKLPPLPAFWQPEAWSRPVLARGKALGEDALQALGQMLSFPRTEGLYAGLDQVRAACTPDSLAAFAWDLFGAWLAAGAPAKDNWGFTTLGLLGNDDTARRLTPLIRAWPGESAHARAVLGLDILEQIGTDTALMLLNGIAQKLKFKGLQDKARDKIQAIADARGLTTQELEDRLAPDLGLDAQGSLLLDFGPRQFKVGFDETLKPWVRDFTGGRAGARLKDLPKPNKADDPAQAQDASERYKALKKDAKTIAAQQIQRLETAMCEQRRWSPGNFQTFIAQHPLVRHIAQRLVWGVFLVAKASSASDTLATDLDPTEPALSEAERQARHDAQFPNHGGQLLACFRLAEDGSLTTADDAPFELPASADAEHAIRVGVPHALHISAEDQQAFGQIFADYELLQPFAQLGRDTYALSEAERQGTVLSRWVGVTVATGKVMGLTSKGWDRGAPQDGGWIGWMEFNGPHGCISLDLDPGMAVGDISWEPEQKLGEVTRTRTNGWSDNHRMTWADLDAIAASELIRALESLR
ncbi:hypothetical protein CCO03_11230 [Comamonas serinivorans]|uniref:WGR domain-containing protein n=1 Tax=Comamonas serinivorans TaxID=1082851 RepID=A0A1Y0ENG1_9BURK|nr:WGR and DUF4132 domain-containing protein [Comamonas serinivorans]ARU05184.1 hypothetical protein CCO03_11230 [Comamonas serinivorans]